MDAKKLDSPTVEERLAKLEGRCSGLARQNRRLKIAGAVAAALVVVFIGAVALFYPPKQVIEAREFRLVDESGHIRALLNTHEHVTQLSMWGAQRERSQVSLGAGSGGFLMLDAKSPKRSAVLVPERLTLTDENGNSIWQAPPPSRRS